MASKIVRELLRGTPVNAGLIDVDGVLPNTGRRDAMGTAAGQYARGAPAAGCGRIV